MRLEKYLMNEVSSTADATNMELAIVNTWNGNTLTGKYQKFTDTSLIVKQFLENNHVSGKAVHMGSASTTISDTWSGYGGTDNTPKTDLKIGNFRISLKKKGPSQLMSGKSGETKATFYSVADDLNINITNIIDDVETYLSDMVDEKSDRSITDQKEQGMWTETLRVAETKHKEFTGAIKKAFDNKIFETAVVFEAMTGRLKFGSGDSIASHLLVFDDKGMDNKWNEINPSYIKSTKTKVNVSWKSSGWKSKTTETGKKYSFYSVLRLSQEKLKNEMLKYEGQTLNEGILTDIWTKFKSWFSKLWTTVKNWLTKSVENVIQFFNLDPNMTAVIKY